MTAAVVLLNFPTQRDAATFVRSLYGDEPSYEAIGESAFAGEVEATIMRPTEWCTCEGQKQELGGRRRRGRPKREQGWTKDEKSGWFICVHCRKPSRAIVVHFISAMLIGITDHTPAILGTGAPRTLFDQRVMEVVEAAIEAGFEEELIATLTATEKERLLAADMPESVADPRFNTALNGGGVSRRSTKNRRPAHPRRTA